MNARETATAPKKIQTVKEDLQKKLLCRRDNTFALLCDVLNFLFALILARCHAVFGAYPLALGWLVCLPSGVWVALLGAVTGALTLGRGGVVYALVCLVAVFLRIIISGGGGRGEDVRRQPLFSEKLPLRLSAAVISGFVAGVYEVLLTGVSAASVLYAGAMVLLPALTALALSGLFALPSLTVRTFFFGGQVIFAGFRQREKERPALLYIQASLCVLLFLCGLALRNYALFGIGFSYLFAGVAVLFVARRFGALRAMAAGFVSCLGLSPVYAVSFALAGLAAGLLFRLGTGYALLGGAAAVALWSGYAAGLSGLVSTFPEYAIAAALMFPLLKKLPTEVSSVPAPAGSSAAGDMVGAMALSLRQRQTGAGVRLEHAFSALAPVLRRMQAEGAHPGHGAYEDEIRAALAETCASCDKRAVCPGCEGRVAALADKLSATRPIDENELSECGMGRDAAAALAARLRDKCAALEAEAFRHARENGTAELCEVFAKIMNEARLTDEREGQLDTPLSRRLEEVFFRFGFSDGVIRAFGDRRPTLIAAGEDKTGSKITSPELKAALEEASGVTLGTPEFFRRGDMVVMECGTGRRFRVESATATLARAAGEVSGDSTRCFVSEDDCFYSVISDGMGTGEVAKRTSELSVEFLQHILGAGCTKSTALHLLNRLIRARGEECSATVDLFELDLLRGEAQFYKSGAAPSYIKRGSSLFRIRSQTVPIGLIETLDAERIRVDIDAEDTVIMLSDGISQSPEDAPWLLELLSAPAPRDLKSFADEILRRAEEHNGRQDDMTVVVARVAMAG